MHPQLPSSLRGFVEIYSIVFSLALHTDRQPHIGAILFVKTPHLSSGFPKRVFILQHKIWFFDQYLFSLLQYSLCLRASKTSV